MNFSILPEDIKPELSDLGIIYDITRQKSIVNILGNIGLRYINDVKPWPNQVELPNDDPEDKGCPHPTLPLACDFFDEDTEPLLLDLFSFDSPGDLIIQTNRAFVKKSNNFKEFVRVSFKDDPSDDIIKGSRCSDTYTWSLQHNLCRTGFVNSDKYNIENQILEEVIEDGTYITIPTRKGINMIENGTISTTPLGPSDNVYTLIYDKSGEFWYVNVTEQNGSAKIEFSNTSTMGPWEINIPGDINIKIVNGTMLFTAGESLYQFNKITFNNVKNHFTAN